MGLKSYQQYTQEVLTEAQGMMSKVPIIFDEDDLAFLLQFPLQMWKQALRWRYNRGIRQTVEQINSVGKSRDVRNVFLSGTYKIKGVGNVPGQYAFRGIQTGQKGLLKKLGGKPPYAKISGMGRADRDAHDPIPYDYDTSKVYQHDDDNPLHFLEGMPVMQSDVATNSLSAWIKANHHGVFGAAPAEYNGQPVQKGPIKKYKYGNKAMEMPCIEKEFSSVQFWPDRERMDEALLEKFDKVYPDQKTVDLPSWKENLPVLLPGRYIPYVAKYDNIQKKPGGLTATWLMNNYHRLSDSERHHFASEHFGPIDHIANDPAIQNGRFYVVGGWTPTAQQKGVHPLFDKAEELDDWLREKPEAGSETWQQILQKEAEEGVMQFVSSVNHTAEGVIMQLLIDDIIKAAFSNLQRNLGSTKIGPFRYDKEGNKKFNHKNNHKNRVRKAYDFAQTVSQTNVSFVNGTRRQREKWGAEGGERPDTAIPKPGTKAFTGGDELLIKSKGSRRWVDIVGGYGAAQGWVGHSIDHMKTKVGDDLTDEAKREASQAAKAKNIEARIKLRGGAIAHTLEALCLKFTAMAAARLTAHGQSEESMTINTDKALASAVVALPAELKRLGIDYTALPKDIVDHFNQKKFRDEDFVGRSAATSGENPGVELLHKLMNDPHGIELGGRHITLQDLAKDEGLYNKMLSYVGNLKSLGGDAKTQRAMAGALNDLVTAVDKMRETLGLPTLPKPGAPKMPHAERGGQFRNIQDQHTLITYFMHPENQARLKADPQLRLALTKQVRTMQTQGKINPAIQQRVEKALADLGGLDKHEDSAGGPFGTKKKKYRHADSQMWGAPGGLGVKSPRKGPIKSKK